MKKTVTRGGIERNRKVPTHLGQVTNRLLGVPCSSVVDESSEIQSDFS